MPVSVNFYWVIIALTSVLALLSALAHFAMRRHAGLAWMACALVAGCISTIVFASTEIGTSSFLILALSDPFSLFAAAQAARLVIGAGYSSRTIRYTGVGFVAASYVLIIGGIGSVNIQCVPFQIGGGLFIVDALIALILSRRTWAEWGMIGGLSMQIISHAVRIPFYPSLLDSGQAYPSIASPWLNWFLLVISSIYVPLFVLSLIVRDLSGHIDQFRETSMRDGLTGLLTRLAFEQAAAQTSPRYGALVVSDLDHFKELNDTYGHPCGDEALRAFARLCCAETRFAARIGGEEFAMLLPGQSISAAEQIAHRIRSAYAGSAIPGLEGAHLSASFGIAAYGGSESFRETLVKADRALYRAKRQGRNCVVLHGSIAGEDANSILRVG